MSKNLKSITGLESGEWPDFEAIYSSCPYLSCLLDREGALRGVNASAEAFFGYSFEELVGRRLTSLVYPPDRNRAMSAIARAGEASTEIVLLRVEWGSGIQRHLKWTFTRIPDSDLVVAWAADVTETRAVQEELRARIDRLQEVLAERTRELADARTEIEDVRHERRNPAVATASRPRIGSELQSK